MGTGPNGSGVTITPAAAFERSELSPQERARRERQERRARLDRHHARDRAFQEGGEEAVKQLEESYENKMDPGPPENKEQEGSEDLEAMAKPDLVALAEERGVAVSRADGRDDLEPTKSDYVSALS